MSEPYGSSSVIFSNKNDHLAVITFVGAGNGNRTRLSSLGRIHSTTELYPLTGLG